MAKLEYIEAQTQETKRKYVRKTVMTLVLLAVACGCQLSRVKNTNWARIGSELDFMAKGREKFGTISLSVPVLVESNKDQSSPFDFTLTTGPDDYYNDAQNILQGKMAHSDQFVKDSGVDLSIQGDISALTAYSAKLKQYEQKLAAIEAQNRLRAEARDLQAQKVMAALPNDATEEQLLDAQAKAAEIRAGQGTITAPEFPIPQVQQSDRAAPPSSGAGDKSMTGFLGLLQGTPDLKISNRSAINTAAGDTVTEAIFTILGNPAKIAQFKDKLMLFGVSMVSVTPGYVTKERCTGELSVFCHYYYDFARRDLLKQILKVEQSKEVENRDNDLLKLIEEALDPTKSSGGPPEPKIPQRYKKKFREEFTPYAAAVSPMTDVDALDLSSSIRNQTFSAMKISAALSYAGLAGQAQVFDDWVRKLEQDTQTRTSYAAVTSFSNGPFFGFRIRPRLNAIKDETALVKIPGYVLEDQAFPAAVIIGIDTDDLKLAFEYDKDGKLVAYEPTIAFHQTVNWLPNKEVSLWDMLNGNHLWDVLRGNLPTETKRLKWLQSYLRADEHNRAMEYGTEFNDPNRYSKKFVANRIRLLSTQILSKLSTQYLPTCFLAGKPVKKKPTVDEPNKIFGSWYDAPSTYVIDGNNFEGQVVGANIGGQPCEVEVVGNKIALVTSCGWTPRPDPNTVLAEKRIAQAGLDIAIANKGISDIRKILKEADESLLRNPSDQAALERKKKAEDDLTAAENALAIAEGHKRSAEADKRSAIAQTAESGKLQIDLITAKGSIKAGFVRFVHRPTPAVPKTPPTSTSKTDATLTITRNAAGKILTISSKGESEEVDKLIAVVREGEKTGANVDLKLNASGRMAIKAEPTTK